MQTLLVTKADFAAHADLPESLDMARLTPHILAAQRTRLQPLLKRPLLDELLLLVADERAAAGTATPDPLTGAWATLRELAGPVVCCAALARYMPFALTTQTATGIRVKSSQYSEAADGRDLARMASIYDGDALSFEAELQQWLTANASSFAGFYPRPSGCGAGQPGRTPAVVVQAITRPDERPLFPTR